MATILSYVTLVVEAAASWIGEFISVATTAGNELLLVFMILPLVGLGIGLLKRLLSA